MAFRGQSIYFCGGKSWGVEAPCSIRDEEVHCSFSLNMPVCQCLSIWRVWIIRVPLMVTHGDIFLTCLFILFVLLEVVLEENQPSLYLRSFSSLLEPVSCVSLSTACRRVLYAHLLQALEDGIKRKGIVDWTSSHQSLYQQSIYLTALRKRGQKQITYTRRACSQM